MSAHLLTPLMMVVVLSVARSLQSSVDEALVLLLLLLLMLGFVAPPLRRGFKVKGPSHRNVIDSGGRRGKGVHSGQEAVVVIPLAGSRNCN